MVLEAQRDHLRKTIDWAQKIRSTLQPILHAHGNRVHFRPSSLGFAMIGLLPRRPQRGASGLTDAHRVVANFEDLFRRHCDEVEHRRLTGEKELQSFLIRESQLHDRVMTPVVNAAHAHGETLDLLFVTDEQVLPVLEPHRRKRACDLLALRRLPEGGMVPVLLELKDERAMKVLIEQVETFSALIDLHADLFAQLFTELLGFDVTFTGPVEKWIVWPALRDGTDPRRSELSDRGIRAVSYERVGAGYEFRM